MHISKRILISLHSAVFLHKNFVKILLLSVRIHLLGHVLPSMPFKNCNFRARLDILENWGSIVHHENFVPKTLFDFLMKCT